MFAPDLRFPEFTESWEVCRFEDVCHITTGNKNTQDKEENGIYPFYVRSQQVERINSYTFDGEAILTAGDGVGVGKVFHHTYGKIGVHQRVYILSDFKCDGRYLFYYFSANFYDRVKRMSAKNSVDSVRYDMIAKMKLWVPEKKEQQKIGTLLSLLDERISTQSRAIEKLQSLMKALNNYLQDHVEKEITLSFSEMGSDYSGLTGKTADDFGLGKPYIPYINVYANTFIDERNLGRVFISEGERQPKVQKGDVIFTLSSETPEEVCYGSVYWGEEKEIYLNSFCFGVHITNDKVFSPYLAYFVNSTPFRKAVFPLAQGSTRYNLQKSDFLRKPFVLPSLENQKRIFLALNAIDKKIQTEQSIIESYRQQKSFLLNRMFI